jgi:hypothetical protein
MNGEIAAICHNPATGRTAEMTISHHGPQDLLWPIAYAGPLAGLRPETAARICGERAERARADGITWAQIGEALGLGLGSGGKSGHDLGVAAFEHVTGEPGLRGQASFRFRCASCGGYITDRGPLEGHPGDNERGHAEGCVRLAADIVAWRARHDPWGLPPDARETEDRPVTLTITYEMIRSTATVHAGYGDGGGGRVSWPTGLSTRPWLSAGPG